MVILPRFNETQMLQAIQKYQITWSLVVPPMLITLLNSTITSWKRHKRIRVRLDDSCLRWKRRLYR